jgi:hypothetical protein
MKQLSIWVFGAVAGTLLGSCAIGVVSVEFGGRDAVTIGRDLAIFIIALMAWISALVGFAIWFGLAAGVGAATNPAVRGLRWVGTKSRALDEATARVLERFVIRPLALALGYAAVVSTARSEAGASVRRAGGFVADVARQVFSQTRTTVQTMRPRGKVVVTTGIPTPSDLP